MNAIILSVGDELALGQTVDTNSAWLSQQLAGVGCGVAAHVTVPDDQPAVEQAIAEAVGRCDVLLVSGGIGPTDDDVTRQALAAALRVPLVLNEAWLARLEQFFRDLGRAMPPMNRIQAMIPHGTTAIHNSAGTAAGIDATYQSGDLKTRCRIFVMPGVPKEMKTMFARDVLPHVRDLSAGGAIVSRSLHTFGLGESTVAERLGDLVQRGRNPSVGTTVSGGVVTVRISARAASAAQAQSELATAVGACRQALGDLAYGEDEQTLADVVASALLARPGLLLATAESCTGGLLAKMLTDVPGSSIFLLAGWITYSPQAKTRDLDVDKRLIDEQGIVSEAVAIAMAQGACRRAGANHGLGITGVAGPGGGSTQTPVGTVCIGLAAPTRSFTRTFRFPGDREMVRDRAAKMALTLLRYHLMDKNVPF